MHKIILLASCIVFFLRICPVLFAKVQKLNNNKTMNRYLDYVICLITGEIIYSVGFDDVKSVLDAEFIINIISMASAAIIIYKTNSLGKSFSTGVMMFIILYILFI